MTENWRSWVRAAVDLVYPRNCQICEQVLAENERGVICGACLGTAKRIEPPCCRQCALPFDGEPKETFSCGYCQDLKFSFSRAVTACRAEGVVREAIHRFKYNRQMYFGGHLEDWLIGAARRWIEWCEVDAIVPVPLHSRKQREREFNQAEVLARSLSRAVNLPVLCNVVCRVKDTPTQTRLTARERRQNLRGAFAVRRPEAVAGRRLVLVDDVFTTGVTLDSCAKVLRVEGAQNIIALTVARKV